jgi:hypothetical protein
MNRVTGIGERSPAFNPLLVSGTSFAIAALRSARS